MVQLRLSAEYSSLPRLKYKPEALHWHSSDIYTCPCTCFVQPYLSIQSDKCKKLDWFC